jgi:PQQ-dependent catabolism-associated CXXCW motif protein
MLLSVGMARAPAVAAAMPQAAAHGTILLEGGGYSSPEVLQRIADLVGRGKQLCVITTADPEHSAGAQAFAQYGVVAKAILVTSQNADSKDIARALAGCDGYYLDGGLPRRLSLGFLVEGRDSLALATLRKRYQEGATIAGTSAGAMILGPMSLCNCGPDSSVRALAGVPLDITPGFHFVDFEIDAHAFIQNHFGRELVAMEQNNWQRFVAVNESTAVEIPGDGSPWRVLGNGPVGLISAPAKPAAPMMNYDISIVAPGDRILAASFAPQPIDRVAVTAGHQDLEETPIAGQGQLLQLENRLIHGLADVYGWDPILPTRTRLAWTDHSAQFKSAPGTKARPQLLTHLSLSIEKLDRDAFDQSMQVPLAARLGDDWGVPPIEGPRQDCVDRAATPIRSPGVKVVHVADLDRPGDKAPAILVNVFRDDGSAAERKEIAGSTWIPEAGDCGTLGDATEARLAAQLASLTQGDLSAALVFYCEDAACWRSYNAAQRAHHLGYGNVGWFRGGLAEWIKFGGSL